MRSFHDWKCDHHFLKVIKKKSYDLILIFFLNNSFSSEILCHSVNIDRRDRDEAALSKEEDGVSNPVNPLSAYVF